MSKISVLPPSGFRDFPPKEAATRAWLVDRISQLYRAHGFLPISTSAVENLSTLQGKGGGGDNEKLIFRLLKRGEELERALEAHQELADLGLRFDLTLPLARFFAKHRGELPRPAKIFQIGPVWRADRPQKGRFREFFQCDVDIIGAQEIGAELDCITAILEVFGTLGITGVEVHLNDRRLLSALGRKIGIPDSIWTKALISLDKLDKIGVDGVIAEIGGHMSLSKEQSQAIAQLAKGGKETSLDFFRTLGEEAATAAGDMQGLLELLQASGHTNAVFNPSLVRGQDYYTGTIFELRHPNLSGSLAGGGRYNRLLEIFGAESTPAFGGSIGFERLVLLLQEKGVADAEQISRPQVFFPLLAPALRGPVTELAAKLRAKGLRVDVYPDAAKLKNQFKYADDRQIPYTAILGENELAQRQIKVKDMRSATESAMPLDEFLQRMEQLCRNQ